jgi:hypothetical protein
MTGFDDIVRSTMNDDEVEEAVADVRAEGFLVDGVIVHAVKCRHALHRSIAVAHAFCLSEACAGRGCYLLNLGLHARWWPHTDLRFIHYAARNEPDNDLRFSNFAARLADRGDLFVRGFIVVIFEFMSRIVFRVYAGRCRRGAGSYDALHFVICRR